MVITGITNVTDPDIVTDMPPFECNPLPEKSPLIIWEIVDSDHERLQGSSTTLEYNETPDGYTNLNAPTEETALCK